MAILTSTLLPTSAAAQTLPSGWTHSDIGSPTIPGFATHVAGTYTVSGAGTGVGGTADQFTFLYRKLTGDGTVLARIASLQNTNPSAKAGVMIRETLSAGSRNAFALVSPASGVAFQRRQSVGGTTASTTPVPGAAPVWLKVVRSSSTITAAYSADGVTWTGVGSDTVTMAGVVYVGLAVTSQALIAATIATFTNVQVQSLADSGAPLPAGWSSGDIGPPAQAGAAAYEAGTFGLRGGGADIGSTWDQFRFAYTQANGDVDIVARVRAIGDTNAWAEAGVMIRESLTPNASHASMLVSSSQGTAFQRRPLPGGGSVSTGGTVDRAPVWLKLSLRGNAVTASQSLDGATWNVVGTDTLTVPSPFYVGLAVTSHDDTATVTTNIDNVTIGAPAPNQPPSIALIAPANGATYTAPATITIDATASDTDGTIARVEFYQGSTLIGIDAISPYSITWSNVSAGTHSLTAIAIDNAGGSTTSAAHTVTVSPAPNQPPSIAIAAPANGATYTAPATITINATATDPDGTITRVEFYQGATLLGTATTSPYSVTWSDVPAGTYSLTAIAVDNSGTSATSAARTVTVNPPPNQPPGVAVTAPANGATYTAPATITINATATDTDGTIARVEFFQGSTLVGSDTTSPYSVTWSDVPAGTYSLTAIATDNAGANTTSAAHTVTVNAPLPTGWTAADVGSPSPPGQTTYSGGTFMITAGGADVGGTSDQFHFAYQQVTGDLDIVARVAALGQTHAWSKAGVMIRASLAANAAHASMFASGSNGVSFQRRLSAGGVSEQTSGGADQAPVWIKLSRRGDTITGFRSTDGVTWTQVDTASLMLPAPFYAGLAVTSHDTTATVDANLDNVTVQALLPNQPPSIVLTAPASGASYTAPATITINASASDADGTIARVEFYQGSTLIGADTTSPYSVTWSNVPSGTYSLTAVATDDRGARTTSGARTVTVEPASAPVQLNAVFNPSPDHDTLVNSYLLEIFAAGADTTTATPIASQNLGKPAVVNGECSAVVTQTINELAPGNYQATVAAVGSGGSSRSSPITLTR